MKLLSKFLQIKFLLPVSLLLIAIFLLPILIKKQAVKPFAVSKYLALIVDTYYTIPIPRSDSAEMDLSWAVQKIVRNRSIASISEYGKTVGDADRLAKLTYSRLAGATVPAEAAESASQYLAISNRVHAVTGRPEGNANPGELAEIADRSFALTGDIVGRADVANELVINAILSNANQERKDLLIARRANAVSELANAEQRLFVQKRMNARLALAACAAGADPQTEALLGLEEEIKSDPADWVKRASNSADFAFVLAINRPYRAVPAACQRLNGLIQQFV